MSGEGTSQPAITGVGVVGSWGAGWQGLEEMLRGGHPVLSEVARPPRYHRRGASRSRLAALVPEAALRDLIPAGAARRMSWPSRLAVSAARLAVRDAGVDTATDPSMAETGVAIATTYGPASFTEQLLDTIFHSGPEHASPALFTESVASAAASQISIDARATGPCLTITQREAGVLLAVADAAALVRRGQTQRMLAGAVEEATPLLHSILDRFGALALPEKDGGERARPFDRRRGGILLSEGAVVVVVEPAAVAAARGARIWCRILGAGSAFDGTASPLDWGSGGAVLAREFRAGLARAGLEPGDFDLIVSGAAGSRKGDRLEASMLRALWNGQDLPPIVTPKAVTGEYAGGFLAAALLAVARGAVNPRPADFQCDPGLEVAPSPEPVCRSVVPCRALVTTLAAGGAAAWLALDGGSDSGSPR